MLRVPHAKHPWETARTGWAGSARAGPFLLADGSGPAEQQTIADLCWDGAALHVRWSCTDRDVWSVHAHRDDPLYEAEAVELFLAPGRDDPRRYVEIELSPSAVLFDAIVSNPHGRRETMHVATAWDCPGVRWDAGRTVDGWWAAVALPLREAAAAAGGSGEEVPRTWRANLYRIERPRDARPELSCWSPTLTSPADFHQPARFGVLELLEP